MSLSKIVKKNNIYPNDTFLVFFSLSSLETVRYVPEIPIIDFSWGKGRKPIAVQWSFIRNQLPYRQNSEILLQGKNQRFQFPFPPTTTAVFCVNQTISVSPDYDSSRFEIRCYCISRFFIIFSNIFSYRLTLSVLKLFPNGQKHRLD